MAEYKKEPSQQSKQFTAHTNTNAPKQRKAPRTFVDNRPHTKRLQAMQAMMRAGSEARVVAQRQAFEQRLAEQQSTSSISNQTGLPKQLKTGVEQLSGYSMDDVKVHYNSAKPAQLQAHAYAQGTNIHIAPGQEQHLPHEAWHVVQQKQGRVPATTQLKGKVNINDDARLEKEADVMGAKALQMKATNEAPLKNSKNPKSTVQRMATSRVTSNVFKQLGGTCGLYSLALAISGIDDIKEEDAPALLSIILQKGNKEGTYVGEFMDADKLAKVARALGLTVGVISFANENDMEDKLTETGTNGVIMGYSVYDLKYTKNYPMLNEQKYLFSHWSVVEGLSDGKLTIRDPNAPDETREVDLKVFWQNNQDASNESNKFDFGEYEKKTGAKQRSEGKNKIKGLRERWEQGLYERANSSTPRKVLNLDALPTLTLNLKGKIVSIGGKLSLDTVEDIPGATAAIKEKCTLRDGYGEKIEKLSGGDEVQILEEEKEGNKFDLGLFSRKKTHYWVLAESGKEGWVRKNAIVK